MDEDISPGAPPVCFVHLNPASVTKLPTLLYRFSGHCRESAECTESSTGNIWIWPLRGVQDQENNASSFDKFNFIHLALLNLFVFQNNYDHMLLHCGGGGWLLNTTVVTDVKKQSKFFQ